VIELAYQIALSNQWISTQLFPVFLISFYAMQMFFGAILIVTLPKRTGRVGCKFLIISIAFVVLGILIWDYLGEVQA